jgi:hypothetical protein
MKRTHPAGWRVSGGMPDLSMEKKSPASQQASQQAGQQASK